MNIIQNTMLVLLVVGGLLAMLAGNVALGIFLVIVAMVLGTLKDKFPDNDAVNNEGNPFKRDSSQYYSSDVANKKCQFCAELINIEAITCRYCGNNQQTYNNNSYNSEEEMTVPQGEVDGLVCFYCGTVISADDTTCPGCKIRFTDQEPIVILACSNCGWEVSAEDEICPRCKYKKIDPVNTAQKLETMECPMCAETIKSKAKKCRYCGHLL